VSPHLENRVAIVCRDKVRRPTNQPQWQYLEAYRDHEHLDSMSSNVADFLNLCQSIVFKRETESALVQRKDLVWVSVFEALGRVRSW
jgi:hypothetical protein